MMHRFCSLKVSIYRANKAFVFDVICSSKLDDFLDSAVLVHHQSELATFLRIDAVPQNVRVKLIGRVIWSVRQ